MNIVLQHWTGELDALSHASIANISAYAAQCGAAYRLLRGNVFRERLAPPCQKLYMLDTTFDEYDTVLMVDVDMFAVRGLKENVFEVPGTGLFSEYTAGVFLRCRKQFPELTNEHFAFWGGAIWKLSREQRQTMRAYLNEEDMTRFSGNFNDEGIMHRLACKARIAQDRMPDRWCQCSYLPNPEQAAFIHVRTKVTPAGPKRPKIDNYMALRDAGVL